MGVLGHLLGIFLICAGVAACGDNLDAPIDALPCTPEDDTNPCTIDECDGETPIHTPVEAGTACPDGVCSAGGECVGCNDNDDCTAPLECNPTTHVCESATCSDGSENGSETDVDCGGSCAPGRRCDDGEGCAIPGDCVSGVCTAQVCRAPACGDGVRQGNEACDDGNQTNGDGCDDGTGGTCRPTGCGNGTRSGTEECDDGNAANNDGCDNNCTTTRCGNGIIAGSETCDDLDTMGGDGCSATCQREPGYTCTMVPSVCVATCGDGVVVTGEACDDPAPAESGDGCSATCTIEPGFTCGGSPSTCTTMCGDGIRAGAEGCDDPPPVENGDGCNASCFVEPGWVCTGTPSLCFPICGDGRVVASEGCDDPAPAENGDGCSATCLTEPGYTCTGSPSSCTPICGDGVRLPGEACDDMPPAENGDGCSMTCTVELGWTCTGTMPSACSTTCGDGIRAGLEECDDTVPAEDGDGCSALCTEEPGWDCTGFMPSVCLPGCGDGLVRGLEQCDDAPPEEDGDGCSATCQVEPGYVCSGEPSVCAITCGDGDIDAGEMCDDDDNVDGDGCSAACQIEFGFTCSGTPSSCVATCGDGVKASIEACDDAAPAEDNDGCSAACTIETGYTCTGTAPSVCVTTCGDGVRGGAEQCDDGCGPGTPGICDPGDNGDGCSATCTLECGDGTLNPAIEQCEDGNRTANDGCSPTCTFEVACGAGETLVQINSTDVPRAIPDSTPAGIDSNAVVPVARQGAIRKAVVGLGRLNHTFDGDLIISLVSPVNRSRNLIVRRGGGGDNLINTRFDDNAATSIVAGAPPYTGAFQPEQTISSVNGFGSQSAAGTWRLHLSDNAGGDVGTLLGWTLSLCVDPSGFCGNGVPDPGEECDDGNTVDNDTCSNSCGIPDGCGDGNLDGGETCDDDNVVGGDGCSASCQVDIACGAGETPVVVTVPTSAPITDDNVFTDFPVTMPTTGAIRRTTVFLTSINHSNTGQLDIQLQSPGGIIRDLSSDNGSTANYVQTGFDDTAATAITAGAPPYTGRFRPEQSLSTSAGFDFLNLNGAGTWLLQVRDDTANSAGTMGTYTVAMCINATAPYCGDGLTAPGEECDDGNMVGNDACSNLCQIADGCGDGNLDAGEVCDDNNIAPGDGCSATCTLDIGCGPGETPVIVVNSTSTPIPDRPAVGGMSGVLSTIDIPVAGVVRRVIPSVSITHANNLHLDVFLTSPHGVQRDVTSDQAGVNYLSTLFSDAAATLITAGVAPYTGAFRPEQSISTSAGFAGFGNQSAAGTWVLRLSDDTVGTAGTLDRWSLALCVDPAVPAVCGNGFVEANEICDDGNAVAGDGCASCQLEMGCAVGQTTVQLRSTEAAQLVPDNQGGTFALMNIPVSTTGTVRKAIAVAGSISHQFTGDASVALISPTASTLDLSSLNGGSGDDYASAIFDDGAATAITAGTPPYRGRFRPEQPMSTVNGQAAAGVWSLRVTDIASSDGGLLTSWSLGLCVE